MNQKGPVFERLYHPEYIGNDIFIISNRTANMLKLFFLEFFLAEIGLSVQIYKGFPEKGLVEKP